MNKYHWGEASDQEQLATYDLLALPRLQDATRQVSLIYLDQGP